MIEPFDIKRHKDICPICGSNYTNFACKKEEWHTENCNCYKQNRLWRDYSLANIPLDYYCKDFSDYEFKEENKTKKYLEEITKYIQYIDKVYESAASLFLYSDAESVGKTFFATSILKEAYRKGYSIYFLQFVHFYNEIARTKDVDKYLDSLNNYDFLVIDSIDRNLNLTFMTDIKVINLFEEFLRRRFKPIVFTSKKPLSSETLSLLSVVKSCLKTKIYELYIDTANRYVPNDYWNRIMTARKEIIK